MRELTIKEATDGFVLMYDVEVRDDVWETEYIPVEDTGDDNDLLRRMLEKVAEHFGMHYDKWGHGNINITFDKKGHKVE